jgi:hypothetical protein
MNAEWCLFGIAVVQAIIFAFQLFVFRDQAQKLAQTVKAAAEQSEDMKESIKASNRAADAMEKSAAAATGASKAVAESVAYVGHQVRAYLSVRISGGFYQDRSKNIRFGVKPLMINTGLTPAYKVRYTARADIFEFPLQDDFEFPLLDPPRSVFGILASQQNFTMNAAVKEFTDDDEVSAIKYGRGKRLYIWGTVFYEDVSGIERYTNFSHNIFWITLEDGREFVDGNFVDRHNDAN